MTTSPTVMPNILDLADDDTFTLLSAPSTLNPDAPAFVPSYLVNDVDEARRIDDILHTVHHLASVYDSETLMQAQLWMNGEGQESLDESTAYFCDREDGLRAQLYAAPRRPKGNTYGRKRR